jgi:hypothetical protein
MSSGLLGHFTSFALNEKQFSLLSLNINSSTLSGVGNTNIVLVGGFVIYVKNKPNDKLTKNTGILTNFILYSYYLDFLKNLLINGIYLNSELEQLDLIFSLIIFGKS